MKPTTVELLAFEASAPEDRAAKKKAIRQAFAISSARYYLWLFKAIDRPEAMRIAPETTLALLKQREQRRLRQGLLEPVSTPASRLAQPKQTSLFETGRTVEAKRSRAVEAFARPVSEGEARKQRGMSLADLAADAAWKERVDVAIGHLALAGEPFTAEEIRAIAGDPPAHPNALGARVSAAAARGVISRVGYRKSGRPSLHSHPIALWVGSDHVEAAS